MLQSAFLGATKSCCYGNDYDSNDNASIEARWDENNENEELCTALNTERVKHAKDHVADKVRYF